MEKNESNFSNYFLEASLVCIGLELGLAGLIGCAIPFAKRVRHDANLQIQERVNSLYNEDYLERFD